VCTSNDCKEYGFDCVPDTQASVCSPKNGIYSQTTCVGKQITGALVNSYAGSTCAAGTPFADYPTVYLTDVCVPNGGSKSFKYTCTSSVLTRTDFDGTSCSTGNVDSIVATSTCGSVGGKKVQLLSCGANQLGSAMTFSLSFFAVVLGFVAYLF
jgi:hypothetical protein